MITKWETIPYPSEKYPGRYKVNIKCDYNDLKKITDFYGKQCGQPWKSKIADFSFSFYVYKMTPQAAEEFENKIKEFQGAIEVSQIKEEKKTAASGAVAFLHQVEKTETYEPKKSAGGESSGMRSGPEHDGFVPAAAASQHKNEEIKVANEVSFGVDFDIFDPEKLDGVEIKKNIKEPEIKKEVNLIRHKAVPAVESPVEAERKPPPSPELHSVGPSVIYESDFAVKKEIEPPVSAPRPAPEQEIKKTEEVNKTAGALPFAPDTVSVGIIFRSGQDESSKIIEENLLKSVAGKKLKYKIKVEFAKGFLVFSQDDIDDAIALCREKNVSAVIVAGEVKLAEVIHEALNAAGIFTEHINTNDVNKKSFYFNIATNIILAESEKRSAKDSDA